MNLGDGLTRIESRYRDGEYLRSNPDWHAPDSPWKANEILQTAPEIRRMKHIVEIGCGAGGILGALAEELPTAEFLGVDISGDAIAIAQEVVANKRVAFRRGTIGHRETFDAVLVMDVVEHVPDPIGFLAELREKSGLLIAHIPLDLSVQSIARPRKLIGLREDIGHIHYFSLETALATVIDAGFTVERYRITRSSSVAPATRVARAAKVARSLIPIRLAARYLGGFSVMVVARPAAVVDAHTKD